MVKMRKEVKDKWLKALRSGEYKQGVGQLKNGDEYCCLGVLCDIHRKTTKRKGNRFDNKDTYYTSKDHDSQVLPESVYKWSGLKDHNPDIKYRNGKITNLAELNDEGKSFNRIANIIEKYL